MIEININGYPVKITSKYIALRKQDGQTIKINIKGIPKKITVKDQQIEVVLHSGLVLKENVA